MTSLYCTKEVAIQNSATLRRVLVHVVCPKETTGIVICSEDFNNRHEVHFNSPQEVRSSYISDHNFQPFFEVFSHQPMEGSFFFCIEAKKERFSGKNLGKFGGAPNRWKIQLLVGNHIPAEIGLSFVVVSKKHEPKSFKFYKDSIANVLKTRDYSLLTSIPDIITKNEDMDKFYESLSRKRSSSILGSTPDAINGSQELSTAVFVGDDKSTTSTLSVPCVPMKRSDESLLLQSDTRNLDETKWNAFESFLDDIVESYQKDKNEVAATLDRWMRL